MEKINILSTKAHTSNLPRFYIFYKWYIPIIQYIQPKIGLCDRDLLNLKESYFYLLQQ